MQKHYNPNYPKNLTERPTRGTKNVLNKYQYLETIEINQKIKNSKTPICVIAENFAHDINIGGLIRNAAVFNIQKLYIVGRKTIDKRATVGSTNYLEIEKIEYENAEKFYQHISRKHPLIAVEQTSSSSNANTWNWQKNSHIIFGQEQVGVSNLALKHVHQTLEIPQYGAIRSLNVASSSAIILNQAAAQLQKK